MKKLLNRSLMIFLAVLAVTFLPCMAGKTQNKYTNKNASALSPVTITFIADVSDASKTTSATTDADGTLDSLPELSHTASKLFTGWYTSLADDGEKITNGTVFQEATTIYAKWVTRTFNYTAQNNGSNIKLIESAGDFSYVVGDSFSTMASVMEKISQDNTENKAVSITFDKFSTTEQLEFTPKALTLSGNITTTTTGPAMVINLTGSSSLTLTDFTLAGNSSSYASITTSGYYNKLFFTNCNFSATTTSDYGFSFNGDASVTINTFFSHSSKFLFAYNSSVSRSLTINKLSEGSKIVQSAPYTLNNAMVASYLHSMSIKYFQVLPTDDFYQIELSNSATLATAYVLCEFMPNGGEFKADYTPPTRINFNLDSYNFPTSSDVQLLHNNFCGWAGKLTFTSTEVSTYNLDSDTYYFDKNMLSLFADNGSNMSNVATYFKTNLDELNKTALFAGFSSTNKEHLNIFCNLKKQAIFVAEYEEIIYSINFETNSADDTIASITGTFGSPVTIPQTVNKTGHTFAGWCTDSTLEIPYTPLNTMPDTNPTLYAKWTVNSYNLIIHHNNGTNNTTILPTLYGNDIVISSVTYFGHEIDTSESYNGCYLDTELSSPFTQATMPAQNLDLYIKWKPKTITIYFNSMSGQPLTHTSFTFGTSITAPTPSENPGYTFNGWYTDTSFTTLFDFETFPDHDCTAYAYWIANEYTITFDSNGGSQVDPVTIQFSETISEPFTPIKKGFRFDGWFEAGATSKYIFSKMPNKSFTLTAKWTEKSSIELTTNAQSYTIDSSICKYVVESKLDDFVVKYFVNGEWSHVAPSEIGTYDVSIFRAEDNTYKEVSYTIKNGLVIENRTLNIAWVIVLVYFAFLAEIALVVFLRFLRGKKARDTIALSLSLPIGIITTNQLVLFIVGAVLVVAGLVLMIYEFVKLHYTTPDLDTPQSATDNNVAATRRVDKSEDAEISKRVDELLKKEAVNSYNLGAEITDGTDSQKNEPETTQNEDNDTHSDDLVDLNDNSSDVDDENSEGIFLQDFDDDK